MWELYANWPCAGITRGQMAEKALFTTVTFQRQPGLWRAAISRKDRSLISRDGEKALGNVVTPSDSVSEVEAEKAAAELIRQL